MKIVSKDANSEFMGTINFRYLTACTSLVILTSRKLVGAAINIGH